MFRLSLRELLVFVALVACALASLRFASDGWLQIVVGITMLVFFAMLIRAAVDRGPRQVFALGFVLVMASYGIIIMQSPGTGGVLNESREFDPWRGRLPTTRLLRYAKRAFDDSKWIDDITGQEIPDYDPSSAVGPNIPLPGFGGVHYREVPPREFFFPIGHCWWTLLLGYLGGRFAMFVYARRIDPQAAPS